MPPGCWAGRPICWWRAPASTGSQPFLTLTSAEWDDVQAINLRGVFLTGREVARSMIAAGGGGSIVNLASTAALAADAGEPTAHYNASKAGVVALTRQMAVELAPHGIRVNCVCPGVIDTPMLRMMDDADAGERFLRESVPLARLGAAREVAAAIAFLASPGGRLRDGRGAARGRRAHPLAKMPPFG